MRAIYKYRLDFTDEQHIKMPAWAEILSVQVQYGNPYLWAMVDDSEKLSKRIVIAVGTGHEIKNETGRKLMEIHTHIGTTVTHNDTLVTHFFDGGWEDGDG